MEPPPKRPRTDEQQDLVSPLLCEAITNLENAVANGGKTANTLTAEVEESISKLRTKILIKIDEKLAQLKADVQTNLKTSLQKLKLPDPAGFTGLQQRLICPEESLLQGLGISLNNIYILQGKHITDLPRGVLSHIIEYLPLKSIGATRAVSKQFYTIVQRLYQCENCRLSTIGSRGPLGPDKWLVQNNKIATPGMHFEVRVATQPIGVGVFLRLTKWLIFTHPLLVQIQLSAGTTQSRTLIITACDLHWMARGPGFSFGCTFPLKGEHCSLSISLVVKDCP
ncbi:hypothetical protein Pelo_11387 [Pelomyxa schiedti]|nr:hypothetical protein Pelo_11387 [Pelomyxa schiedti]